MQKFTIGHLLLAFLILSGCTTQPPPKAEDYFNLGVKTRQAQKGRSPQVGLALAGGGTKAADFSIGVLQGLTESGVMEQVDPVSTVSGGGYAALWYFTRLLNPAEQASIDSTHPMTVDFARRIFSDCLPVRYKSYALYSLTPERAATHLCPQQSLTNFEQLNPETQQESVFKTDPTRYQNYLRGYQDLFQFTNPTFSYGVTSDDNGKVSWDIAGLILGSLAAMPLNIAMNVAFDWEVPLSVSEKQYESGILRTFGAIPPNCSETNCPQPAKVRPKGDTEWVRSDLTFDLLRTEYEKGSIPLWIINTTAGENRANPFAKQGDFDRTSFEFSPYGSGSGIFAYSNAHLGNLRPWEAVVSSAAFIDSQQKVLGWGNSLLNPLIKISTVEWGRSIPNPHASLGKRLSHKFLPYPLYLGYGRSGNSAGEFVSIRLSDGGQSENLGAYALVQRQLKDLIISDHSEDGDGKMEDVCRLKKGLVKLNLFVYIPGLAKLDQICSQEINQGYDIFKWEHPIVLGCITSNASDVYCTDTSSQDHDSFRRLYLIKPALPNKHSNHKLGETLSDAASACANGAGKEDCTEFIKNSSCRDIAAGTAYKLNSATSQTWVFEDTVSCELLGFIAKNSFEKGKLKHGGFPQLSTVNLTTNSSPWIFGAYRELGRYYARQLGWFLGIPSHQNPIDLTTRQNRYQEAIKDQINCPLLPVNEAKRGLSCRKQEPRAKQ